MHHTDPRQRLIARASEGFVASFARPPDAIALAPGRVNLIGEHTDYNDGLVLPIAIDAWCACAVAPRADPGGSQAVALDVTEHRALATACPAHPGEQDAAGSPLLPGQWMSYVAGVLHALARGRSRQPALNLALTTDIPIGGGLSSSAALEVSVALAILHAWGDPPPPPLELARLCQRAEHDFAGVPCGLMDQCASILGNAGHAILLDCRSLAHEHIPLPESARIVVVDTGVRHALAAGQYARRRDECARACRLLGVNSLRDVALPDALPESHPTPLRRARHVVTENQRVLDLAAALRASDAPAAGRLMDESHRSLRDDYQVSCVELDRAVEGLRAMTGVHGARMTGGGFGGCAIALVEAWCADQVAAEAIAQSMGTSARVVRAEAGAALATTTT